MKLSIVIPCYNVENEIERCVNSIINQNIHPMEVILVNDGSTDSTPERVDRLAKMNPQVKVIHQKNGGLSDARNTGIDAATGEYITFVDSDDYISEGIYESLLSKMEERQIDLGIFNVVRIYSDEQIVQESIDKISNSSEETLKAMFELKGVNFYAWNKIIKRHLIDRVYFEKDRLYEDIMYSYQLSNLSNKAVLTEEVGYNYIDNDDSIVNQEFNPKQYDNVTERIKLYEGVKNTNPTLSDLALDKLVDGFLSTGFKLASSESKNRLEYVTKLKNHIKMYSDEIKESKLIILPKKLALSLFMMNLNLYRVLYKMYLRK